MKKVSSLIVLSLTFAVIACGKHTKKSGGVANKLNRYIDAQVEGSFSVAEKTLGNSFCNYLSYKKSFFPNAYAAGTMKKKFSFDMEQKLCTNVDTNKVSGQLLTYSTIGGLTYESAGAPGIVPFVETDTLGVFSTYCSNRNQNSRVYNSGGEVRVYHFFPGTDCGGQAGQICAVYEKSGTSLITDHYKRMVVADGAFLGHDLKGQEVFSEEQGACGGSLQSLTHILRSVTN